MLWYLPVSPWSWSYTFACMISVRSNRGRHRLPVSSHLIFGLWLLSVLLNSTNQWSRICRFWPGSIMYVLNKTWTVCHGSIMIPGYHGSIICSVGQHVYFTILQIYLFFILCWKVKHEPFREFNNMTHAHLHVNARRIKTTLIGYRMAMGGLPPRSRWLAWLVITRPWISWIPWYRYIKEILISSWHTI